MKTKLIYIFTFLIFFIFIINNIYELLVHNNVANHDFIKDNIVLIYSLISFMHVLNLVLIIYNTYYLFIKGLKLEKYNKSIKIINVIFLLNLFIRFVLFIYMYVKIIFSS